MEARYVEGTAGRLYWVDVDGRATLVENDGQDYEGPTCPICDALGHGYPGAGPCPLEMTGEEGVPFLYQ